jgi:sterol desaturase/sphingolipid hydroxylase (fatty acid hydroxylase superfamily)
MHRSLHQSWAGRFNKSHMAHHQKLYPPSDYQSETYRNPGKDNTVFIFVIPSIFMLAIPVVLGAVGVVAWWLTGVMVAEMLMIGWLHDTIHDAFHLTGHPLNKWRAFREWNRLHFVHHQDMSRNYGIFGFGFDKVFGTFETHTRGEQR